MDSKTIPCYKECSLDSVDYTQRALSFTYDSVTLLVYSEAPLTNMSKLDKNHKPSKVWDEITYPFLNPTAQPLKFGDE